MDKNIPDELSHVNKLQSLASDSNLFSAKTRIALLSQCLDVLLEHIAKCVELQQKIMDMQSEASKEYHLSMESKKKIQSTRRK
jgi:hypothetical protein